MFDGQEVLEVSDYSCAPSSGVALIIIPAVIFRDSVLKNMFHHAGISKRCRYLASSREDLEILQAFVAGLEKLELVGDGGAHYWRRVVTRYIGRWRDLGVYALAAFYTVILRYPIYIVEEVILRRHSGASIDHAAKNSKV